MKKIYLDALSFVKQFLDYGGNSWDLDLIKFRVKKFCELVRNKDIEMQVFIEGGYSIEEIKQRCV